MAVRTRLSLATTVPLGTLEQAPVPRLSFPLRLLLILGVLPLLLAASLIIGYRSAHEDRVYSGVRVFGLDLSRMTQAEAADALKRHLADQARRPFHLRFDEGAITVSLGALGLAMDDAEIEALVDQAAAIGRVEDFGAWLRGQADLFAAGYDVPAAARFDRERARSLFARITADVERVTLDADLAVERAGDGFEIHTSPSQTGRVLNIPATMDRLEQAMVGSLPRHVDLVLDEAPPLISDADLAPAIGTIQVLLGSAIEFRDGNRSWRIEPAQAHQMLEITGLKTKQLPITAKLNDTMLMEFVAAVAREADQPARNPAFDLAGDRIVVRPGAPGKLTDVTATFDLARNRSVAAGEARTVEIVFKADQPWLTADDLEPARVAANARLDVPITLEAPPLPGLTGWQWTLRRPDLARLVELPDTQSAPRNYATLPAPQRPSFDLRLDERLVGQFLLREVAPWVSTDPVDAALELKATKVAVPNPAYAAAVAEAERRAREEASRGAETNSAEARSTPVPTPAIGVPPTIEETRYHVELRNAVTGQGPDYRVTFAAMQAIFTMPARTDDTERRVTVRLAPRLPQVLDAHLASARDLANVLIGEPITVRWADHQWTVTRDELAGMLRYQEGRDGRPMAYLTRDGLLAKAGAIAREAERLAGAPRSSKGTVLPVDVPATAAEIWQQASTVPRDRVAAVVWTPDEEEPADTLGTGGRPAG